MPDTSKERLEILKMIQEGKITPEEGVRLIEVLEADDTERRASSAGEPRWLVVEVATKYLGKDRKINPVRIPYSVVSVISRFIPKNPIGAGEFDLARFLDSLKQGKTYSFLTEEEDRWFKLYVE